PSTSAHSSAPTPNFTGAGIDPVDDQNASTKAANTSIARIPRHSRAPTRPASASASARRSRPGASRARPRRRPAAPAITMAGPTSDREGRQLSGRVAGPDAPDRIATAHRLQVACEHPQNHAFEYQHEGGAAARQQTGGEGAQADAAVAVDVVAEHRHVAAALA